MRSQLARIAAAAEQLLVNAHSLGTVVIVTNAERGWVELSAQRWLPSLLWAVQRLDVEIISARSTWEPAGFSSPLDWKRKTFESVITKFYSKRIHQSWKNVLSIGDSPHEREALQRVTMCGNASRKKGCCRTKAIKFKVRPTPAELAAQLVVLAQHLEHVVMHDDHLDILLKCNCVGLH